MEREYTLCLEWRRWDLRSRRLTMGMQNGKQGEVKNVADANAAAAAEAASS